LGKEGKSALGSGKGVKGTGTREMHSIEGSEVGSAPLSLVLRGVGGSRGEARGN